MLIDPYSLGKVQLAGRRSPNNWNVESHRNPTHVLSSRVATSCCLPSRRIDLGCSLSESEALPRKEVIQPHLPVRLPCYDFTPITDPTLDACLPNGLAQRLQVLPTFVV